MILIHFVGAWSGPSTGVQAQAGTKHQHKKQKKNEQQITTNNNANTTCNTDKKPSKIQDLAIRYQTSMFKMPLIVQKTRRYTTATIKVNKRLCILERSFSFDCLWSNLSDKEKGGNIFTASDIFMTYLWVIASIFHFERVRTEFLKSQ